MNPAAQALMQSWTLEPVIILVSLVSLCLYWRGWRGLHRRMPDRFPRWRLVSYAGGLAVIWLAIASPLDAMGNLLLQAHMTQHLLLMMIAPPLIWLGAPGIPLLRGLPHVIRKHWLGPFLAWPALWTFFRGLGHPVTCLLVFIIMTWAWHWPPLYELGLRSQGWHQVEHACFLFASMLFWWPVVQPWPSTPVWPRWSMIIYLLVADVSNTVFSAAFCFWEVVIYPTYESAPRLLGLTALDDQAIAGAIMWVPGSIIFLVPVAIIIRELLSPRLARPGQALRPATPGGSLPLPVLAGGSPSPVGAGTASSSPRTGFDLLRLRGLGRVFRHRLFRRGMQTVMLLLAAAVVIDGLLGPQHSPMNLAGVLPWIHWRGFVVLALLVAGNLFCFACPFMLPRELARRLGGGRLRWPRILRSKWLAVALMVLFLWAYEAFSLWDTPWWTAWIVITYFAIAMVIDGFFRGASFCKYICPIGQFHFVQSMASPLEVRVRDMDTCHSCTTYDCIRGNEENRGCELDLFLPKKNGGLDCTWCLDCVHACPHDNVGIMPRRHGTELLDDGWRSSLRRLSNRWDVTALVAVLVFGAFANALGMVGPVLQWQGDLAASLGMTSDWWVISASLLISIAVLPPLILAAAGSASQALSATGATWKQVTTRFTLTLVPLGFAMWLVHMLFHLFTSWGTVIPSVQRAAADLGTTALGEPAWALSCCGPAPTWLLPLELLILDVGLVVTLWLQYRLARELTTSFRRECAALLPWAIVSLALWLTAAWIVFQPMEMRGTMPS
ncbi:MAG: cytochrome c oxidase assembly protein [Phycisphaerales bacterium]|nr:cytochrome c oxidase assembly protein [Phycisphaerales bacterium]